jgi:orotidine-5'-phosphate decarboxylase
LSFQDKIKHVAKSKGSKIILALDFPFENPENRKSLLAKAEHALHSASPYICAMKINHHLVLPLGLFDGVQELVKKAHDLGLLAIIDCKVNDIGSTNQTIAEYYYTAGFDALIANPFIGWEEGLQPIFEVAQKLQRSVILLVYMSHKAAPQGYGQTIADEETGMRMLQYVSFAKKALKYRADGVIVGATFPEKIKEVHEILGETVPIFSPGIGAQGGEITSALKAGASYLIVGRSIVGAENPADSAKQFRDLAESAR